MDSLTHIVIGAAIGLTIRNNRLNRKAAAGIGALACTAPDFDVIIRSSNNPLLLEEFHRSFTHALIFIPIGGLLIAGLLLLLFRSLRIEYRQVIMIAIAAYASHGLLDACTSYGTQLFWPFSHTRISWDIISIVDPAFTLPLLLGMLWSYRSETRKPVIIALIYGLLYLGFCCIQHYRAIEMQQQLLATRGQTARMQRVMPTFGSQYRWNSLYVSEHKIYLDTIATPLLSDSHITPGFSVPQLSANDLPISIRNDTAAYQNFLTFSWFAQGYITATNENPLTIVDLRYVQKAKPPIAMWGITFIHTKQGYRVQKQAPIAILVTS